MVVAIDLDGVLADWNAPFRALCEAEGATFPPWDGSEPSQWDWPTTASDPFAVSRASTRIHTRGREATAWWEALPIHADFTDNAVYDLLAWLRLKVTVVALSHRPMTAWTGTLRWLADHVGADMPCVLVPKGSKYEACLALGASMLIDDCSPVIAGCYGSVTGVLVDRPYNRVGTVPVRVGSTLEGLQMVERRLR